MKTNICKSQLEVWEWKEKAFDEIKNLPEKERIRYVLKKVSKTKGEILEKKKVLV